MLSNFKEENTSKKEVRIKLWLCFGYSRRGCSIKGNKFWKEDSRWKKHRKKISGNGRWIFGKSKVKFPKKFLTKYIKELNVLQFITLKVKKKTGQVGLEYGLFSQIVKIYKELVVVVQKSSKTKS